MIFKNRSPIEIEYKKPFLEIKNKDMLCFNSNNKMNNNIITNLTIIYSKT
jgi:hypothetical protein